MGSAFYETTGKMKGSLRDLADMIRALREYTRGVKDVWFMKLVMDNGTVKKDAGELSEEELEAFVREAEEVFFSAEGPYGRFDGLKDIDVFRKTAEAAPAALLEAVVDGQDSYVQEEMRCCLKDGVLLIDIMRNETEDDDRAYLEYVLGKMPYGQFIDLFGIDPDSLAEEDYEDFVNDLIIDYGDNEEGPFALDYDDLAACLENYGAETSLEGDTYEAARKQAEELGIVPECDFQEGNDCSTQEHYEYDAVRGEYIG